MANDEKPANPQIAHRLAAALVQQGVDIAALQAQSADIFVGFSSESELGKKLYAAGMPRQLLANHGLVMFGTQGTDFISIKEVNRQRAMAPEIVGATIET